jgi:hypothetical protein
MQQQTVEIEILLLKCLPKAALSSFKRDGHNLVEAFDLCALLARKPAIVRVARVFAVTIQFDTVNVGSLKT